MHLRWPIVSVSILFSILMLVPSAHFSDRALFPVGSIDGASLFLIYLEEDIVSDVSYGSDDSPILINDTILINESARVTFLPGCELIFGQDAGLIVRGGLILGGDGPSVTLEGSSNTRGFWNGVTFRNGSLGRFEGVVITGANHSIEMDSADNVAVRNSSFIMDNSPIILNTSSMISLYNSSLSYGNISILDNSSMVRTNHYLGGIVTDHLGSPVDQVKIEIRRWDDVLVLSHITNSTGEVPSIILEGRPFIKDGRGSKSGHYNISITDSGETHFSNSSYMFNGTVMTFETFRFTWPPELSSIPERMNIFEDSLAYHYCNVINRNGAGVVEVRSSSPRVTYNRTLERLEFLYTNETYLRENVTITLDDGYDLRTYLIPVKVYVVNDPPEVTFQMGFLYPREGEPARYTLEIYDEDTPLEEISVITDDPKNVTYDMENETLVFLYGDGTPLEFSVNVTISDGNSSVVREIFVYFQPVFFHPSFLEPFPTFAVQEDERFVIDLGPYLYDPDAGEHLFLTGRTEDHDVFSFTLDGYVLTVVPAPDAFGQGSIQLTLKDERDLLTMIERNVTVFPVDDEPRLLDPLVEAEGIGDYWFNITYGDIDGDMPDTIVVIIDGTSYDLITDTVPAPDPTMGVGFRRKLELYPGLYNISFRAVQGDFEVNVIKGELLVPLVLRSYPVSGYNKTVSGTVWGTGEGDDPELVPVQANPPMPEGKVSLNCSFFIDHGDISPERAGIMIWPLDIRNDITILSLKVSYMDGDEWSVLGSGFYDSSTRTFSFSLSGVPLNSTIAVTADLDPEFDSDGDGVKNLLDDFPNDPLEWIDTDGDGTGDNSDSDDDDDGFDDSFEIEAGTDPLSPNSFPKDTDLDGVYDHEDLDDDGDGMPDQWEKEKGLDPMDPSDADQDPDGDGFTNLEEYLNGTEPKHDDRDPDEKGVSPSWVVYTAIIVLVLLLVLGMILFTVSRGRHRVEMEEAEDNWEIQGELEPDEAVECPECSEVYPLWFDECPSCGKQNPYEE
ncbi:MAG: hypothetical protein U9R75_06745 [Candidatus Thermoplasmatota archaeon]|nr:hypothetical protein [Candidatus Thermoplasmatota archaeon]